MPKTISCPNCNQPVDPHASQCPHCGVTLAIAAALAENAIFPPIERGAGAPMSPELLVPRLGEHLVEHSLLEPDDLQRALAHQRTEIQAGRSILLGQALIKLGMIDAEALDQAITEQILNLQQALRRSNQELEARVAQRTAELRSALNKLTELGQLKANFISNISHELRTPLGHMVGYIELLSSSALGPLTDQQEKALEVLEKAHRRLQDLIDNLLQFSIISQGQMSLNVQTVALEELLKLVEAKAQGKASEREVNLIVELPPSPPAIFADEEKTCWALEQLVDNGIKFNRAGGEVRISARAQDGLVILGVADTGIGIPEDRLEEIFVPFHQLDGSSTRNYGGTGIGLSLVQRIVEAQGSSIRVASRVGEGSHFEFALPVADQP